MHYKRNFSQPRILDPDGCYAPINNQGPGLITYNCRSSNDLFNFKNRQQEILKKYSDLKDTEKSQNNLTILRSSSKKSCLQRSSHFGDNSETSPTKKVRFSPETESLNKSKLTASYILKQIRQENLTLPGIMNKKKLYHKLDKKFGFEGCNEYYVNYFISPSRKFRHLQRLDPLSRKFSNIN